MFYFLFVKFCAVEMFKCFITALCENDNEWLYFPKRRAHFRIAERSRTSYPYVRTSEQGSEWWTEIVASNRSLFHRLKTAIFHNNGNGFHNKRLYDCHSQLSHIQVFIKWYILAVAPRPNSQFSSTSKHSLIKRLNYSIQIMCIFAHINKPNRYYSFRYCYYY